MRGLDAYLCITTDQQAKGTGHQNPLGASMAVMHHISKTKNSFGIQVKEGQVSHNEMSHHAQDGQLFKPDKPPADI